MAGGRPADATRFASSKVPEVTVLFWVAKLLTTGMGETTWDWMDVALGQVPALTISAGLFVVALVAQFRTRAYRPVVYWFAVAMVSVFGTTAADLVHNDLGVPYTVSTTAALVLVGATFAAWYACERTLSIHSIHTRRREAFYWTAVFFTFALGTAAGDWTATTLHLGYLPSGLIFLVVFLLPGLGYWRFRLDAILAFWLSYIVTRPLGASFADWMGGPPGRGGMALGLEPVSLALMAAIVVVVVAMALPGRGGRDARVGAGTADGVAGDTGRSVGEPDATSQLPRHR